MLLPTPKALKSTLKKTVLDRFIISYTTPKCKIGTDPRGTGDINW
jgi:hypothetical protein